MHQNKLFKVPYSSECTGNSDNLIELCLFVLQASSPCNILWHCSYPRICNFVLYHFSLPNQSYVENVFHISNCLLVCFSLYMFKLGLAPQIQDLYGKVQFTGEFFIVLVYSTNLS